MKLANPWIDPRILDIQPEAVRKYLLDKEWECLDSAKAPDFLMFDTPQPRGEKPNVLLPLSLNDGYTLQRMIELITEVALFENRYAGDVLTDICRIANCTPFGKLPETPAVESQTSHH